MLNLFYRNVRLLILTTVLIFVWGLSSYLTLPRLEDPILVSRDALIQTIFPGADAQRVESLVTEKIEEEIAEIEEIKNYESVSRANTSIITIQLLDRVEADEAERVWSRIRDRLDDVLPELPPGAAEPEFEETDVKAYALITGVSWERDDPANYAILRRKAESLRDQLRAIKGTEAVDIFGDPDEEIIVEVQTADLVALNLTPQNLSQQIQLSDSKTAAGQLRGTDQDLQIEVEGELKTLERIRNIPIRFGNNSQFTRLGDLAMVEKGIAMPPSDLAFVEGHPAVVLGAFVEADQQIDGWAKSARQILKDFERQLPDDLGLRIVLDQSRYVEARLDGLMLNLLLGAFLVFVVTLLMMGWRSAMIVGSALPLSVLMVFGGMKALGISLNQMSVTGLIVAMGILIDNAIVVVDEVQDHLKQGLKPAVAIRRSVRYLAIPLFSSTVTTVLAFMPIALLPGSVGEFVGAIGLNVILAVCSSLLLALTVVPALAGWFLRQQPRQHRARSVLETGFSHPWLTRIYRGTLDWTTQRPVIGVLLALALPLFGFVQGTALDLQFFPAADRDQLRIEVELPAAASLSQTQSVIGQVRDRLLQNPQVEDVHWFLGESAPQFYYNLIRTRENESNFAQGLIQLQDLSTSSLTRSLQDDLDRAFPQARAIIRQLEQGPPFDAPIEMRVYGPDLERLQGLGEQLRAELAKIEHVVYTRDSLSEVLPQLNLQVDEEAARLAGLTRAGIAQQLETSLEGSLGGSILEESEELPVRVRVSSAERGDLSAIASLDLLGSSLNSNPEEANSLQAIPLTALTQVQLVPEVAAITRRNGQRVNTIQGFISAGVLPAVVLADFQRQLAASNFQFPPGYSYEFGGEAEERNSAIGGLVSTIGILVVLMVATLVLSLRSFQLAGLIGVVAGASFGLGLLSVWVFGYPFGFNPIIGTVGLIGLAINDSIVVLAALQDNPAARKGNPQAVRDVVLHATRHVLTTTFTTIIGFLPLVLDGGEFWPPLAVTIAGGVGGATILALYFVPCAYLFLKRDSRSRSSEYAAFEPNTQVST